MQCIFQIQPMTVLPRQFGVPCARSSQSRVFLFLACSFLPAAILTQNYLRRSYCMVTTIVVYPQEGTSQGVSSNGLLQIPKGIFESKVRIH
jgi:hypothetical protein